MTLQSDIGMLVEGAIRENNASRISVFYRDLDTLRWFGINETENFAPGSLLKLPLAIAYYKFAELKPESLDHEFTFLPSTASRNEKETFKPVETLKEGKTYAAKDLIKRMLAYSDNDATALLGGAFDRELFKKVSLDLEVYFPTSGGTEQDFLSVRTYARILRALYNSSYLSPAGSNAVLSLMSETTFSDGLRKGVPSDVVIAHKFGERVDPNVRKDGGKELHDCGIIYRKSHPYILCVMTEGADFGALSAIIGNISQRIYDAEP